MSAKPCSSLVVLAFFFAATVCAAQPADTKPQLWGGLRAGPYNVGFTVLYKLDRSRVWSTPNASNSETELARPVRTSVWYPAKDRSDGRPMRHGHYVKFDAPNAYFARLDSLLQAREIASWTNAFRGSGHSFQEMLALPVLARMDAKPSDGAFPVVMYSAGWNSSSQHDNSVLAEFLASHGYIVASVPQVGTSSMSLTLGINPVDLETQMRDIEFAMSVVHELPFANRAQLAVMGWSMGGVVSLWLAGRNSNIDAIVGLDASFRARDFVSMVLGSPYFDIRQIRASLLALQSGNAKSVGGQDDRVVDSLHFADRLVGRVANVTHGDFSDFGMVARLFPLHLEDRTAEQASRGHVAICEQVLQFLDTVFRGRASSDRFASLTRYPQSSLSLSFKESAKIPSEPEWVAMVDSAGFDRTLIAYEETSRRYPTLSIVRYPVLNRLGYSLRDNGKVDLAIGVFRLNVAAHPSRADAYDSLADGYIAKGDSIAATRAYDTMLTVLEGDASLSPSQRKDYQTRAEQFARSRSSQRR